MKEARRLDRAKRRMAKTEDVSICDRNVCGGDVDDLANGGDSLGVANGGMANFLDKDIFPIGIKDLDLSDEAISDFTSFLASSNFPDQVDTDSEVFTLSH